MLNMLTLVCTPVQGGLKDHCQCIFSAVDRREANKPQTSSSSTMSCSSSLSLFLVFIYTAVMTSGVTNRCQWEPVERSERHWASELFCMSSDNFVFVTETKLILSYRPYFWYRPQTIVNFWPWYEWGVGQNGSNTLKCKTLAVICSLGENKTLLSRFSFEHSKDFEAV